MSVLYAQTSGNQSTNANNFTPMPGLTLSLPGGVDVMAIVTLNIPMPYATGTNTPGGTFGLAVNNVVTPVVASFTYNEPAPTSTGRIPTTLVVGVPLTEQPQTIQAMWYGVRGSTVHLDSPATLSAIIDD